LIQIAEPIVPFADASLPANAELRIFAPLLNEVTLSLPSSETLAVALDSDAVGQFIDLPRPLATGRYSLLNFDFDGPIDFEVSDLQDGQRPQPPLVSANVATEFINPVPQFAECPRNGGYQDRVSFSVEGAEPGDALLLIDGEFVAATTPEGTASYSLIENRGGEVAYSIQLRDFAGNESEAATAEVYAGCYGGCSTGTPMGHLFAVLLLLRRRRRAYGSTARTARLAG